MRIRFCNAKLLCLNDCFDIIKDGELWTKDCYIEYAGPKTYTDISFDRTIDCHGDLLMPGFKNAHTHSSMTFLRSMADGLPLQSWLNDVVFPIEKKLTPEDVYHTSKLAILEYLTSGITSIYDMYYFTEAIAAAITDSGFRGTLCGTVNDFAQSVDTLHSLYQTYNKVNARISMQLGFHAEYTTNKNTLFALSELATSLKAPVSTHLSETEAEVLDCIERNGMTPPAYLDSLKLFDHGGTCFHCVHINDADIKILKDKGVKVVLNPSSNTKLASGIADSLKLSEQNICLALGTDGAASNNALDMFREMYMVFSLANIKNNKPNSLSPKAILNMAIKGGAIASGMGDYTLEQGKLADIIRINLHSPNMQPVNNMIDNIVYSGSKINVYMTMVHGKILYENGEFFLDESPESIYAKANQITKRLKYGI